MIIVTPSSNAYQNNVLDWSGSNDVVDTTLATLKLISAGRRFVITGLAALNLAGTIDTVEFCDDTTHFFSITPISVGVMTYVDFGNYPYTSILAGNDIKARLKTGTNTSKAFAYGFELVE